MKTVSLVIPALNESQALPLLLKRLDSISKDLPNYRFEFLFIDDGSSDGTDQLLIQAAKADSRVSYIILSRNFGKDIAVQAGLDQADGDAVVTLDADLQDPPELIGEMLGLWEQGYQNVYARRRSRSEDAWPKRFTAWAYYRLLQRTTRTSIQLDTGDFRLLDRRCVLALRQVREHGRQNKALFSWIGYKKASVDFDRPARAAGSTKYGWRKMTNHAIDGLLSFTTVPLRLATVVGALTSLAAFIYMIYLVIRTAFYGTDVGGYPSTVVFILFLGGAQLLALGIIGEYVGRIFMEVKRRPNYLVSLEHRSGWPSENGPQE